MIHAGTTFAAGDVGAEAAAMLAAAGGRGDVGTVLALIGGAIVLVIAGAFVMRYIRARTIGLAEDDRVAAGWLLDSLREAEANGEISREEYERARAAVRGRLTAGAATGGQESSGAQVAAKPQVRPLKPLREFGPAPEVPNRVARPGRDLTGEPLPGASTSREPGSKPAGGGPVPPRVVQRPANGPNVPRPGGPQSPKSRGGSEQAPPPPGYEG